MKMWEWLLAGGALFALTRSSSAQASPLLPGLPTLPAPAPMRWLEVTNPADPGVVMQQGRRYRYASQQGPLHNSNELKAMQDGGGVGSVVPAGEYVLSDYNRYEFVWKAATGFFRWPWSMFEHGETLWVWA